jgi:hypothetical protein
MSALAPHHQRRRSDRPRSARSSARRVVATPALALVLAAGAATLAWPVGPAFAKSPSTSSGAGGAARTVSGAAATRTSSGADSRYFVDVATEDPALSSYVNSHSTVALKALLTTGVAFCDLLQRGGGIDKAMTSVVEGANSVEATTHLPRSVRTFNSIDTAALLALCPGDQRLVPASDRSRLRALAHALAASQPAGLP